MWSIYQNKLDSSKCNILPSTYVTNYMEILHAIKLLKDSFPAEILSEWGRGHECEKQNLKKQPSPGHFFPLCSVSLRITTDKEDCLLLGLSQV